MLFGETVMFEEHLRLIEGSGIHSTSTIALWCGFDGRTIYWRTPLRYLILVLAIAGMLVSGLALKVHYDDPGKEPCSINDKWDCGVVNHSPYAVMFGVPVAAIGIAGYLLIAALGLMRQKTWLLISVLIALAFTLYLTNVEKTVLGVWCLYCVISQGIIVILTLLAIGWVVWSKMRPQMA